MDGWVDKKVNFMLRINEMNLINLYIFDQLIYLFVCCLQLFHTEVNITIKRRGVTIKLESTVMSFYATSSAPLVKWKMPSYAQTVGYSETLLCLSDFLLLFSDSSCWELLVLNLPVFGVTFSSHPFCTAHLNSQFATVTTLYSISRLEQLGLPLEPLGCSHNSLHNRGITHLFSSVCVKAASVNPMKASVKMFCFHWD